MYVVGGGRLASRAMDVSCFGRVPVVFVHPIRIEASRMGHRAGSLGRPHRVFSELGTDEWRKHIHPSHRYLGSRRAGDSCYVHPIPAKIPVATQAVFAVRNRKPTEAWCAGLAGLVSAATPRPVLGGK